MYEMEWLWYDKKIHTMQYGYTRKNGIDSNRIRINNRIVKKYIAVWQYKSIRKTFWSIPPILKIKALHLELSFVSNLHHAQCISWTPQVIPVAHLSRNWRSTSRQRVAGFSSPLRWPLHFWRFSLSSKRTVAIRSAYTYIYIYAICIIS